MPSCPPSAPCPWPSCATTTRPLVVLLVAGQTQVYSSNNHAVFPTSQLPSQTAMRPPLAPQHARRARPPKRDEEGERPEFYTRPWCSCAQTAWPDGNYHLIIRSVRSKGLVCVCACVCCLYCVQNVEAVCRPGRVVRPIVAVLWLQAWRLWWGGKTCKENKTVWCAKRDLATQCNNYQKRNAFQPKSNECRMYVETGGLMMNERLCACRTVLTSLVPVLPREVGSELCLPRRGCALGQGRPRTNGTPPVCQ